MDSEERIIKKQKINNNNNNNKIIPNYLNNKIIELLINHFLIIKKKKSNNLNNNKYKKKLFLYYLDEILTYSLVSKAWFETISKLITNNIIDNENIQNWFSDTSEDCTLLFKYREIMKTNQKYSIIKIEESIIDQYFTNKSIRFDIDDFKFVNDEKDLNSKFNYLKNFSNKNKSYLNLKSNESVKEYIQIRDTIFKELNDNESLNKVIENLNNNMKINIIDQSIDEDDINIYEANENDKLQVNQLKFEGINMEYSLSNIYYCKPKHIIYNPNGPYCQDSYYHMNYSQLFNPKSSFSNYNNDTLSLVKSIEITDRSDHVEPIHLHGIEESFSNLSLLSIPILFHDLFRCLNNEDVNENGCDYHYGGLDKTTNIKEDFDKMINSLSNCKSLKNLILSNFCTSGIKCIRKDQILDGTPEPLSNGIKTLLSSNNIEYLKLKDIDFINDINTNLSPLTNINNNNSSSSIKTLILKSDWCDEKTIIYYLEIVNYLISNIYKLNLRYLKINIGFKDVFKLISLIFENLIKQQDKQLQEQEQLNSNLYNIEFSVDFKDFEKVFDYIKLLSNNQSKLPNSYPIVKEFHMYISMADKDEKVLLKKRIIDEFYISNLNNNRIIINIY